MPVVSRPSGRLNAAVALGSCILGWFPLLLMFSQLDVTSSGKLSNRDDWSAFSQLQAEFSVPNPRGVFFLRDNNFDGQRKRLNSTETSSEVLLGIVTPENHVVQASYGPFKVEQDTLKQNTSKKYYSHVDIATYIVKSNIRAASPVVKVIFHVTHGLEAHNNGATSTNLNREIPCLKMYLLYNEDEQTAACKPHGRKLICLLETAVPNSWWRQMEATGRDQIKVYYTIEDFEENSSCEQSSGNSIRLGKLADNGKEPQLYRVGDVTMMWEEDDWEVVRDNPHIWLRVPREELFPGTKFNVGVVLPPNSTLSTFSIRARAKKGIKFSAVSPTEGSGWDVDSSLNDKQSSVLINAEKAAEPTLTSTTTVCEFEFEVENMTSVGQGLPHVSWRIDYRVNDREGEEDVTIRTSTLFSVNTGRIEALVPLRKEKDLVNTAILNGVRVSFPLSVIKVGFGGEIEDVTNTARCVSVNPTIVKAAEDCSMVYLDGTEDEGTLSVEVIVAYSGVTEEITYSVWVPELPLTVTMTDEKLSLIKSWKVPELAWMNRFARNTDYSNPTSLLKEDTGHDHDRNYRCHLRYQNSMVDVYTRFYSTHENSDTKTYLFNESLLQKVTDLIQNQLKVSDKTIASLRGHKVVGLSPGTTHVEVLAPSSNEILGSKEFSVASDKVSVIDLQVNLVTGLALTTKKYASWDDVVETKAVAQRALFAESQKGLIDITVLFDDGKAMSLTNGNFLEYSIDMSGFNHIIAPSPTDHPPGLIALAEGTTSVLLKLKLPESCQKPNKPSSNELKETQLNVIVEFTPDGARSILNKTRNGFDPGILHTEPYPFPDVQPPESSEEDVKHPGRDNNPGIIPIDNLPIPNVEYDPSDDEDYEPSHPSTLPSRRVGLSELEIGMYALLGIFCLAIIVFLINCILFAARYKSKRIPNDGRTVANAHDWVWLGKPPDCVQMGDGLHETIPLEVACSPDDGEDSQADEKGAERGEGVGGEQGSERGEDSSCGDQGNEDTPGSVRRNHDLESGYHSKSGSQEIRITINPGHCEEEESSSDDSDEDSVTETVIANIVDADPEAKRADTNNPPKSEINFAPCGKADNVLPYSEHLRESQA